MSIFSGRKFDGSASAREEELWKLVNSLQREKEALYGELALWRERYLRLAGVGDMTVGEAHYAPKNEEPLIGKPLGEHVSIVGLRHKYEERQRLLAREKKNDPA